MITLADGKYGVRNVNGLLYVYRHGEPWLTKQAEITGDNFVLALVQRIEELEEKLEDAKAGHEDYLSLNE